MVGMVKNCDQQSTEVAETEGGEGVINSSDEEPNKVVSPYDDPSITGDDLFIRGVTPYHIVPDAKSPSGRKISSALFSPSSVGTKGISGDLKSLLDKLPLGALRELKARQRFQGTVSLMVRQLRKEKLLVGLSPLKENICHCEAWGTPKVSKGIQRTLLKECQWDEPIEEVTLHA